MFHIPVHVQIGHCETGCGIGAPSGVKVFVIWSHHLSGCRTVGIVDIGDKGNQGGDIFFGNVFDGDPLVMGKAEAGEAIEKLGHVIKKGEL